MGIFTQAQKLLIDYLISLKISRASGLYIVGILWEEAATMEMLEYIAETRETDPAKLYSIACEISERYKNETEE